MGHFRHVAWFGDGRLSLCFGEIVLRLQLLYLQFHLRDLHFLRELHRAEPRLGVFYLQQNDWEQARSTAEQLLRRYPEDQRAQVLMRDAPPTTVDEAG